MRAMALLLFGIATLAQAREASETIAAMRAAFPDYDLKEDQANWHRERGQGPKGVFAKEWAKNQVRVSSRAMVPLGNGGTGLIVSGTSISQNTPNDCHACSGMLSLIPVKMVGGRWTVAGLAHDLGENGSNGAAGDVKPVILPKAPGISAISGWSGQGYTITVLDLWKLAPTGAGQRLNAEPIRLSADTAGVAEGCDGKRRMKGRDCYSIDGKWVVSPANGSLTLTFSGMRNGQPVVGRAVYRPGPKGYQLASGPNLIPEV